MKLEVWEGRVYIGIGVLFGAAAPDPHWLAMVVGAMLVLVGLIGVTVAIRRGATRTP